MPPTSLRLLSSKLVFLPQALAAITVVCLLPAASAATITNLQITASVPSPQPLGTPVTFQASASTSGTLAALDYQFSVQGPLDTAFHIIRDFRSSATLKWAPIDAEGVYQIRVIAKINLTTTQAQTIIPYTLTSRVTGNQPVINVTSNPLVLLYSAPACPVGSSMLVQFALANAAWTTTSQKSCLNGLSMNFYIAGLQQNSVYYLQQAVITAGVPVSGPVLAFPTGKAAIALPAATVLEGPVPPSSTQQPVILQSFLSTQLPFPYPAATDLSGHILWYSPNNFSQGLIARPVPGGTMLMIAFGNELQTDTHLLYEADLAGNPIRETNAAIVSQQLAALKMYPVTLFDHDALRLPNGYTAVLGITERLFSNVQGATGLVDILGDTIAVLDQDFQLVWAWSVFDHLNINQKAVLGEVCTQGGLDCAFLHLFTPVNGQANDWTHGNSLDYNSADGSLLLSLRHQDLVMKIDYGNGSGDGHVIWSLGSAGNFSIVSSDPNPWFSHQHDVNYESVNPEIIDLFDNGNTRIEQNNGVGYSRGQVLQIDETAMTATLSLDANIGVYSPALGTAEKLLNGNYSFLAGASDYPQPQDLLLEFTQTQATPVYGLQTNSESYRAFRMQSLYAQ